MPRVIFVEPKELEQIEPIGVALPDPTLVAAVDKAINKLPANLRELVIQKVKLGMTARQIAKASNITEKEVVTAYYEAKRQLKIQLADFVFNRWGIKSYGICTICGHPRQDVIDKMLHGKRQSESWGSFNRRLMATIGERFTPPKLLIAHLNHIKTARSRKHESR